MLEKEKRVVNNKRAFLKQRRKSVQIVSVKLEKQEIPGVKRGFRKLEKKKSNPLQRFPSGPDTLVYNAGEQGFPTAGHYGSL